jgi:hypothetical protein
MLLLSYSLKQLDHHVKDHKAFKLKVKEKILEDKSGKWRFQTKDFDFIVGDALSGDNIFKNAMRRPVRCLYRNKRTFFNIYSV